MTVASFLGLIAFNALLKLTLIRFNAEVRLKIKQAPAGITDRNAVDPSAELQNQVEIIQSSPALAFVVAETEIADLAAARSWRSPTEKIVEAIHVDTIPKESGVRIRASDADATVAMVIARATANGYQRELANRRAKYLQQLKDELNRQIAPIVKETPAPVPTQVAPRVDPRLGIAEIALSQMRADQKNVVGELAALRAAEKPLPTPIISEEAVNEVFQIDPFVLQKLRELQPIEDVIQKTVRIAVLGEKEPSIQSYIARRDAIRQELTTRRTAIRKTLEQQQARQNAPVPDLRPQINALQERMANLTRQEAALTSEIESIRAASAKVVAPPPQPVVRVETPVDDERRRQLEDEIHTVEKAGLEPYWVTPLGAEAFVDTDSVRRRQTVAVVGGVLSFVLGILFVGFIELRQRRVTSARDVSRGLGLLVFGSLPRLKARTSTLAETGKDGEAVDVLRTTILGSVPEGPCVIVVTDSGDGEGKSALAAHLAASLARSWHKTVLIDGSANRSELQSAFGIASGPGLAEVLRGEVEAHDTLQPTAINRLWVMPAGRRDAAATQALAHGDAYDVFDPLKEQFDCVIVDAASLGANQDALLLGPHADAVVLSVLSGVSRLPEVYAARQRLEALGGPVVGAAVLNAAGEAEGEIPLLVRRPEHAAGA